MLGCLTRLARTPPPFVAASREVQSRRWIYNYVRQRCVLGFQARPAGRMTIYINQGHGKIGGTQIHTIRTHARCRNSPREMRSRNWAYSVLCALFGGGGLCGSNSIILMRCVQLGTQLIGIKFKSSNKRNLLS